MNVCKCIAFTILAFSILGVSGCRSTPSEPSEDCAGAKVYVFGLRGDDSTKNFTACTSDPDLIQHIEAQLQLPIASRMHIHGDIAAGNAGNFAGSWHFVKDAWTLADMSIELCDGDPLYIEQHLDAWLAKVGAYCPWSSYVLGERKAVGPE
jgi:hypothetical protein